MSLGYINNTNGIVVELVDTTDSKSVAHRAWGFDSPRSYHRDVAQSGSASGLGPEGRRFKSCHPDHFIGIITRCIKEHVEIANSLFYSGDVAGYKKNILVAKELQNIRDSSSVVRAASLYLVLASDKRKVVGSNPTCPTREEK